MRLTLEKSQACCRVVVSTSIPVEECTEKLGNGTGERAPMVETGPQLETERGESSEEEERLRLIVIVCCEMVYWAGQDVVRIV